jgi:prepilin-type N-terminal cleavage/methylation domain-containing protein
VLSSLISITVGINMNPIKRNAGFTLVELVIVLAIIAILGLIIAGGLAPKKAGAATPSSIPQYLRGFNADFVYSDAGTLTLFNGGNGLWRTSAEACAELKQLNAGLKSVTTHKLTDGKWVTETAICK